ncbi:MAG: zinc dependent phospholipase C family protein [Bacillota bacterium]
MPDFWTHILGGELVIKELKQEDEQQYLKMITDNQQLFNLGCQGPDIFFYNDFWPWIKEKRGPSIGEKMHQNNVAELFKVSLEFLKQNQNSGDFSQLFAYLSGFVVHYALDKRMHPFVYQQTNNFTEHKKLEINMDTYFANKYWNKLAHRIDPTSAIDVGNNLPQIVIKYYATTLEQIYDISDNELKTTINDSYQDYKRVFSLFYSRWRFKRILFKFINPLLEFDISTLIYPTHLNYELLSSANYKKIEHLLLQAVGEAKGMSKKVISILSEDITTEELKNTFPNINFNGNVIQ